MFIAAIWEVLRIGKHSYTQEGGSRFPIESFSYGSGHNSLKADLLDYMNKSIFPYKVNYLLAVKSMHGLLRLDMPLV